MLARGGTSVDAVEIAVRVLEDSPLFNAGKGSAFTRDGRNEMDAAIMDGRDKRAGAGAGVTTIRNAISAARAVMEKPSPVMIVGRGAGTYADVGIRDSGFGIRRSETNPESRTSLTRRIPNPGSDNR